MFVERFRKTSDLRHDPMVALEAFEADLNAKLPTSFIEFASSYGSVTCDGMLDGIVDLELDLWDVMKIEDPVVACEITKMFWEGGMPSTHIVFGADSSGNAFCFQRLKERAEDLPVFLFDHDFVRLKQLAEGFDVWLRQYLELIPSE